MGYDSVYEMTNYLRSTVRKQHFWDYFSGAGISFTTQSAYNYTGGSENSANIHSGSMYGQILESGHSGIGKIILRVDTPVKKYGSPTGNATIRVYAGNGTTILAESSGLDVSTLTTSYVNKTFVLSSNATLEANSRVVIYYSGGDSSNYINIGVGDVGGAGSNTSSASWNGSSWVSPTTRDTKMTFDSSPTTVTLPPYRWTLTSKSTPWLDGMNDSVNGGYKLHVTNGHEGILTFNNKRQYAHNGSVWIAVCNRFNSSGIMGGGLKGDDTTAENRNLSRLAIKESTNKIQAVSCNTTSATYSNTSVTSVDSTYFALKGELGTSSIIYSVDGVTEVTHTTAASDKLPDAKLQPYVYASANGSNSGGNVLYVEAYNT